MGRMRGWTRRAAIGLAVVLAVVVALGLLAGPYLRAAGMIARAASVGGRVEQAARAIGRPVRIDPPMMVPTRYGPVDAQRYEPDGGARRTTLLIPGIHSMGIREPRLTGLARDLAAAGVRVLTLALPDLTTYRITPKATDVIEDAVTWASAQPDLAADGRVGLVGISFAGGLSLVAAARPTIREHVAYVVSFGGHGNLPRVMRYLATGEAPRVPGVTTYPPHDYGVAVILYGLADQGIVPDAEVAPLRAGIETFLLASQLTLVDTAQAEATFRQARAMVDGLDEPAATYLRWVNDRAVDKLGPALVPYLDSLRASEPALSPERAPGVPAAPVFLLHGRADTVIPTAESVLLADTLRMQGVDVHLLLSELITHAEVDRAAAAGDVWQLVRFWAEVLQR